MSPRPPVACPPAAPAGGPPEDAGLPRSAGGPHPSRSPFGRMRLSMFASCTEAAASAEICEAASSFAVSSASALSDSSFSVLTASSRAFSLCQTRGCEIILSRRRAVVRCSRSAVRAAPVGLEQIRRRLNIAPVEIRRRAQQQCDHAVDRASFLDFFHHARPPRCGERFPYDRSMRRRRFRTVMRSLVRPHTVSTACVTASRTAAFSALSHSTIAPRNVGRTFLTVTGVPRRSPTRK